MKSILKKNRLIRMLVLGLIMIQFLGIGSTVKVRAAEQKTGYVNYTYLNLRSGPSTKYGIIVELTKNDQVVIKKTVDSWYQVSATHGGKQYDGYVASRYITLHNTAASSGTDGYVYRCDFLNLRKGAGTSYSIITKLYPGDKVKILAATENKWYKVTATKSGKTYTGYVNSSYIKKGSPESAGTSAGSTVTTKKPNGKVIYLTFDDGPGKYTKELLDVLDKYNVKATFFVTNQFPNYQYLIKEEAKRGHTVAIHTYSHEWKTCYSSVSGYFKDLEKMQAVIKNQTGKNAKLIRFPGGSSNKVSASYCKGIMSKLVKEVEKKGYVYTDWNVSSGDAGDTTSTTQIIKNIEAGCKSHKYAVVLQHDIKSYSVKAVESVIKWGLENGYTFKAMSSDGYVVHSSKLNN